MTPEERVLSTLQRVRDERIIMILRSETADDAERAVEAAIAGGITLIEITYSVPGAAELIARLSRRHGDAVCIGAGTVLDAAQVDEAADAGARFAVSPATVDEVVAASLRRGLLPLPGVMTPSEALRAVRAGAPAVKLFPARSFGPAFVRDLLAPLPDLVIVPSGGVDVQQVGEWLGAGAAAVGLGGRLSPSRVAPGEEHGVTERAAAALAAVNDHPRHV
ncbi:bifunctional 4-hydroxy-2-oxoglutarate aldolase/2-dehydro-3-deoxy-phosphogluconate aldolase [Leucobacter muris]|uniref:Bifunctional 4-hydroxy-2-oxoglutarate aldolase/2-dehydro-3-deoxy-phosphogluconate aldolase n=1 Tax=Leucobacter muris TaxID=1935379 RepID=A0ABX5QIL4_9MICO|nr:bifunctional 4-hydroxy-2-oxoglutarate aldolase/2-dehydro-3-deoxy-phosphogluconate aldolase [Leucobacter muris]QAB18953.1 bifunctional 4-hydroxy-2-oxoglutarate aldolase/2-dehydro-3-deoxy-phosphogluconate aldolase [Leucobacter muris]